MTERTRGVVDVVVGGQYGDEGKGAVCADLHHHQPGRYRFAIRVGGDNAEHRFVAPDGKEVSARILPCSAWCDPKIRIFLGAGHMFRLTGKGGLLFEINSVASRFPDITHRISIDPQAGVIDVPSHCIIDGKGAAKKRGSTHRGVGAAKATKVRRDGVARLARDYKELDRFTSAGRIVDQIDFMLSNELDGLLEGSQGALLALDHGWQYPFCTSSNTTAAGAIAEAGVGISDVGNVWSVFRYLPMRVPGPSGPTDGRELSWSELEERLGCILDEKCKIQTDSGNRERIFEWSWKEWGYSMRLNRPTHIALTFLDYLDPTARADRLAATGKIRKFAWEMNSFIKQDNPGLCRLPQIGLLRVGPGGSEKSIWML